MEKKNTRIHLPMHTVTKKRANMDPFFPVEIQKYLREDGFDDGLRAIVNSNTKDTLGRISEGYNLVTHKEASDLVKDTLSKIGIEFNSEGAVSGTKGAKYFETIAFPKLAFNPASTSGIVSTALDIGGHARINEEVLIPYIVAKNSYDKTARVSWSYGFARPWCSNGAAIITSEDSLSFRHNQEINLNQIKEKLFDHLQRNTAIIEQVYVRLNQEAGINYLKALIDGDFPDKFKLAVLERINPFATIKSKTIEGEKDNRKILEIESIDTTATGYALWNVATEVSTHEITSRIEQDKVDRRIAKVFGVR
jgi:hypothetical protein